MLMPEPAAGRDEPNHGTAAPVAPDSDGPDGKFATTPSGRDPCDHRLWPVNGRMRTRETASGPGAAVGRRSLRVLGIVTTEKTLSAPEAGR